MKRIWTMCKAYLEIGLGHAVLLWRDSSDGSATLHFPCVCTLLCVWTSLLMSAPDRAWRAENIPIRAPIKSWLQVITVCQGEGWPALSCNWINHINKCFLFSLSSYQSLFFSSSLEINSTRLPIIFGLFSFLLPCTGCFVTLVLFMVVCLPKCRSSLQGLTLTKKYIDSFEGCRAQSESKFILSPSLLWASGEVFGGLTTCWNHQRLY